MEDSIDREKVIKGPEYCEEYFNCCDKCLYWDGGAHCTADLVHDALSLLKEQEQRINELKEKLRLQEYGDQDILQSGMMPAT